VAPLNPGVVFASLAGRAGQVATTILTPAEAASSSMEISSVPAVISLADRFEISGRGFCGDADANQVTIAGQRALVLASSPTSLLVLPPVEMKSGAAAVQISCAKQSAPAFLATFVALELNADSSPLKPGEHRILSVQVRGTISQIVLEARNLGPDVAELAGGNVVRRSTSGGANNVARFELVGRKRGSFLVSIRLAPRVRRPAPVR
jgi:hypothetical protein